jgi:hypothetical protein
MIGTDSLLTLGISGIIILNLIFISITYITIGKLIWKCEWIQSVKANVIWIILYAFASAFALSKMSV